MPIVAHAKHGAARWVSALAHGRLSTRSKIAAARNNFDHVLQIGALATLHEQLGDVARGMKCGVPASRITAHVFEHTRARKPACQ
jgi:hypothetical protein